jgi:predicted MFS family arabinose efflux permease
MVNPFLQESFGISLSMAGYYTTIWGIGVVLGATFGGRIYKRIGMRNATLGAMAVGFIGILALAFTGSSMMAWPLVALFGLAYGTQNTVYFALAMKYTVPRIAASMFAIFMAVTNVGQGAGMAVSGVLVDATGFRITFVILAALNLLALPLLPRIFGREK